MEVSLPAPQSATRFIELAGRRSRRELRRLRWSFGEQPVVSSYLRDNQVRKLQVGAGPNHLEGWLNTDRDPLEGFAYLDATRPFPLPDACMHYVFAEHTIEHFTFEVGQRMLRECLRVLEPGGRIRVCTPDMAAILRLLEPPNADSVEARYIDWSISTFLPPGTPRLPAFAVNQAFRGWGHRFIYDAASLAEALTRAGFAEVTQYAMGESDESELRGIDSHGATDADREFSQFETLAMEAVRRDA